jgi:hypothetical protein
MAQVPKSFVGRDQTVHSSAVNAGRRKARAPGYQIQHAHKFLRDLNIDAIARLVKRDKDFIRQAPHGATLLGVSSSVTWEFRDPVTK